jgi:hypothetical protein
MNPQSKFTPIHALSIAMSHRRLGSPKIHQTATQQVNEGLGKRGQPAITLDPYLVDGVEQVHRRTTTILRSHVLTTRDQQTAIDTIMTVVQEGRKGHVPYVKRRWSIDCSTYSWDQEHVVNKNYARNPAWQDENAAAVYGQVDSEAIYAHNYTPTGDSNSTFLETENATINKRDFINICRSGYKGWFTDDTVNMSFDMLERALKRNQHCIALLPVHMANNLHSIGEEAGQGTPHYDTGLLNKLRDKDFIFIPISDAYSKTKQMGK